MSNLREAAPTVVQSCPVTHYVAVLKINTARHRPWTSRGLLRLSTALHLGNISTLPLKSHLARPHVAFAFLLNNNDPSSFEHLSIAIADRHVRYLCIVDRPTLPPTRSDIAEHFEFDLFANTSRMPLHQ